MPAVARQLGGDGWAWHAQTLPISLEMMRWVRAPPGQERKPISNRPDRPGRKTILAGSGVSHWRLRDLLGAILLLCAPPVLSGCATHSYAGVSFAPGAADPEVQELARRARTGDQHAQLELGIRYEEGRGLPVDLRRAERLYRTAATDRGGTIYVYSPPVGRNGRGQVIAVDGGPWQPGLPLARERLEALRDNRAQDQAHNGGDGLSDCPDCPHLLHLPPTAEETLSPAQRGCGLGEENVREPGFVAISASDPQAETKLECLASAGDHQTIGQYSSEIYFSEGLFSTERRIELTYRWSMVALRTYLNSLGIDLDRADFFEQYAGLGRQPGPININHWSDRIYHYSSKPITIVEESRLNPPDSDRRALEIIKRHRPSSREDQEG